MHRNPAALGALLSIIVAIIALSVSVMAIIAKRDNFRNKRLNLANKEKERNSDVESYVITDSEIIFFNEKGEKLQQHYVVENGTLYYVDKNG